MAPGFGACWQPPRRFSRRGLVQKIHQLYPEKFNNPRHTRQCRGYRFCLGLKGGRPYNAAMKHLTLPIIVQSDADGYFVSCPALEGCYSQGETYEEAVENIKDAIRLHIEDRLADGEEISEPVSVSLSTV